MMFLYEDYSIVHSCILMQSFDFLIIYK